MNVLIIGGNGYIGNRLIDYLQYDSVTVVDRNLYVNDALLEFNSKNGVRYIIGDYTNLVDSFFKTFDSIIFLADFQRNSVFHLLNCMLPHQKFIFGNYNDNSIKDVLFVTISFENAFCLNFGEIFGFSRNFRNDIVNGVTHIDHFCEAVVFIIKNSAVLDNHVFNLELFKSTIGASSDAIKISLNGMSAYDVICNLNRENKQDVTVNINTCGTCKIQLIQFLDFDFTENVLHTEDTILDEYTIKLRYCPNCFYICNSVPRAGSHCVKQSKEFLYEFAMYTLLRLSRLNDHQSDFKESDPVKILVFNGDFSSFEAIGMETGLRMELYSNSDISDEFLMSHAGSFDIIQIFDFDYLVDFREILQLSKQLICVDGLIFLQTLGSFDLFRDPITTDRVSYFNGNSMKQICTSLDLYLNAISNSVYEISERENVNSNVSEFIYQEIVKGMYSDSVYNNLDVRMRMFKNNVQNRLYEFKLIGKKVLIDTTNYSLVHYLNVNEIVDYIIGEVNNCELLAPGSDIPVRPIDFSEPNVVVLTFSDKSNYPENWIVINACSIN